MEEVVKIVLSIALALSPLLLINLYLKRIQRKKPANVSPEVKRQISVKPFRIMRALVWHRDDYFFVDDLNLFIL